MTTTATVRPNDPAHPTDPDRTAGSASPAHPISPARHRVLPHAHDVPDADCGAGVDSARPVAAGLAGPYADAMAVKLVDN